MTRSRPIAIVPALDEEGSVGAVVDEIRAADPSFEILVVDDGSTDRTAEEAAARGARVVRLLFNLGTGGAVQTGFLYALEHGFDIAVQVDGDGRYDPAELPALLTPILAGEADLVVGSRFAGRGAYRASLLRRVGMGLAWRLTGLRLTDPASGFRVANRLGIALFAELHPRDYPAAVAVARSRLRVQEVPVAMRSRSGGRSSTGRLASPSHVVKALRRGLSPAEPA